MDCHVGPRQRLRGLLLSSLSLPLRKLLPLSLVRFLVMLDEILMSVCVCA